MPGATLQTLNALEVKTDTIAFRTLFRFGLTAVAVRVLVAALNDADEPFGVAVDDGDAVGRRIEWHANLVHGIPPFGGINPAGINMGRPIDKTYA